MFNNLKWQTNEKVPLWVLVRQTTRPWVDLILVSLNEKKIQFEMFAIVFRGGCLMLRIVLEQ